ncbi:hypothetical protein [Oceanobacillus kimchii]|uniref:Phage protein n=1 Tax=Oceanobacillus kimchii TaxID=746691 RepID=A0ABQ5TJ39_9BACI|nr:hypothetical protein [Oceanobacillus kimchii]GLO66167.1 hypothetical protein MACH08_19510 [Oceanobacillus kimchii]
MNILKDAIRLDKKYKAVSLDLFDIQNDQQRIIDEIKFQMELLKYSRGLTDEELDEEGYTDKQIERMKNTAIKHMQSFIDKWDK